MGRTLTQQVIVSVARRLEQILTPYKTPRGRGRWSVSVARRLEQILTVLNCPVWLRLLLRFSRPKARANPDNLSEDEIIERIKNVSVARRLEQILTIKRQLRLKAEVFQSPEGSSKS